MMPVTLSKSTLLSTTNLSVGYKGKERDNILLENLNLTINSHELTCFMGPNGIGKSTLIRTLAGLQNPLSGNLTLGDSQEVITLPKYISVVLTDKLSSVNMTVYELVTYGRYPYLDWNIRLTKDDTKAIDQAIELTHISSLAQTKIYELSDGQLQMAMIARALAQDTPLLLLDEPTAHLDLNNRVEIMNLLRTLSRTTGKGILVATHELDLALQTTDTIWLTGRDKNVFTGIPEDLVLNGTFDDIFQFKGFDLKTGKVQHEAWRGIAVNLIGDGPEYLWTKNALERNGFLVSPTNSVEKIEIINHMDYISWKYGDATFNSLSNLLNKLEVVSNNR